MIVNRKMATEAWDLLRGHARVVDEVWDMSHLAAVDHITEDNVNEAFRIAARYTHPDQGGSVDAFVAADRAKHIVLKWLGGPRPAEQAAPAASLKDDCPQCGGTGYVKTQRGFAAPLRRACPKCRGTGDLNYDHEKTTAD